MKKYLTLAIVLGAIAFLSVSYLAQAEDKPAAPAAAAAAPAGAMAPATATPPTPAATGFKVDSDMCAMIATAPTTEGAAPSAEAKDAAFKKCMTGKGHTEEELKKAADEAKAHDAPKADAPKADAPAAAAPAAK